MSVPHADFFSSLLDVEKEWRHNVWRPENRNRTGPKVRKILDTTVKREVRVATPSRAPESPTFYGPAFREAYRRLPGSDAYSAHCSVDSRLSLAMRSSRFSFD